MTYDLQTLLLIEVDTIAVLANLVCGLLIWHRRREVADRSRIILLLFILIGLPLVGKVVMLMVKGLNTRFVEVLPVTSTMSSPLAIMLMLLYAIEVMRPNWLKLRHLLLLSLPFEIIFVLSILFVEQFTSLHSFADVWQHIGEPNVMLRMLFVTMALLLCLSLLRLPYHWQESSASRQWVVTYVCFVFVISVLFFTWMLTLWMPVHILHNITPSLFIIYYTWFELHERVLPVPMEETEKTAPPIVYAPPSDNLWQRISCVLHDEQLWRNPDLSLDMLCERLGSNKDYVLQSFRKNTDTTFSDYVNRLRVDYMAAELLAHPFQSHKELYFRAGFRSKTAAFTNFKKYKQLSPSEFLSVEQAKVHSDTPRNITC